MAAALNRRDIEMIFRAETDKATRPIGDLTKTVKGLVGALAEETEAIKRGQGSTETLAAITRELADAQKELGTNRSLLTTLNAQENALEKAEDKAARAAKTYAELKEQVAGAEAPTKRLTNSMESAGRKSAAAAENLDKVRREVSEVRDQITSLIGPVDNIQDSFKAIAVGGREIAQGMTLAGEAIDDLKNKQAALAKGGDFDAMAARSPVRADQIAMISQYEDRVQRLKDLEQSLASEQREAASADTLARARQAAALDEVYGAASKLDAEFKQLAEDSARTTQLQGFAKIAQEANASATDVSRFGTTMSSTSQDAARLAASLDAIVNPSQAANRTLDGLESSIERAADVMQGGTKSLSKYNEALNEISAASASALRIAGDVDGYKRQEAAVASAGAAMEAQRTKVLALAAALNDPATATKELAAETKKAEAELESMGMALQRENDRLETYARSLRAAGIDTNDVDLGVRRLTKAVTEGGAATERIRGKTRGAKNPFGFDINEMTNLGYQVNDIITQLSLGQGVFRTLASQGGQLFQIAPVRTFLASLLPMAPLLLAIGAAATVAGIGISRMNQESEALKTAKDYMAALGEQGTLSAQQFADASVRLQDIGVSAEDATKLLRSFNEEGLNPEYLEQFSTDVQGLAELTGKDYADAWAIATEAMTGGYDSVEKLQEAFPFLTQAELDHIKTMFDSGQASEARQLLFERFNDVMGKQADDLNGPWSQAWINFKDAAGGAIQQLKALVEPILAGIRTMVNDVVTGLNYALLRAQGLDAATAGQAAVNGGKVKKTAPVAGGGDNGVPFLNADGSVTAAKPRGSNRINPGKKSTSAGKQAADDAERELQSRKKMPAAQRLLNAEIEAGRKADRIKAGSDDRARLVAAARTKEQNAINDENATKGKSAASKAASAAKSRESAARALANKISGQADGLENSLDQMSSRVAKAASGSLEENLSAAVRAVDKQYQTLYTKLDNYTKLAGGGASINGMSQSDYRAQLDANKKILSDAAQLKVYEDEVNDTLKARDALLAEIEDKAARRQIAPSEAVQQTAEVTSKYEPIINSITSAGVAFATSIAGAKPSAELQAFIGKMQTVSRQNAVGQGNEVVSESANAQYSAQQQRLNQIVSARNSLVQTNNELVEMGAMSQRDAQLAAQQAYNDTQPLIDAQIASMRTLLATMTALTDAGGKPLFDPVQIQAMQAQLGLVGQQAQYTDARFMAMKNSIDQVITGNAVEGIMSIAGAVANWAAGNQSVVDTLGQIGLAFVDFVAQTVLQIAKLILQMIILDAVQKATGIPVAALLQAQSGGNGGGGGLLGGLGKLIGFHSGTSSNGQMYRSGLNVTAMDVAMAPRYHEGTPAAGLRQNEMLAVLEKGEKVSTEEQQRREAAQLDAARAGGAGAGGLRQVLAFGDEQVAAAMQGMAGEQVTLTHLRRNVPIIKQMMQE